jgi:hypothetical protein
MDNIITLIFIIIAVVSAISKVKAKQKTKSGARPAAGNELGSKLKAFFAEIQQRIEAQTPGGPSGASRWDALRQAQDPSEKSYEISLEDLKLEEARPPKAQAKKPPARPARVSPQPAAAQPAGPASAPCEPELVAAKSAQCPEFLRRAIVWSEILGPPVALRDDPRKR